MGLMGHNVSVERLRGFVERLERLRAERAALNEDIKVVKAEASASGFNTKIIDVILKRRAAKPHDVQEADALLDMYSAALGMDVDPPLFRYAGLAKDDPLVREVVLDKIKTLVPGHGDGAIVLEMGGHPVRLSRDKDGEVIVEDAVERPQSPAHPTSLPQRPQAQPVPACSEDEAEDLGATAGRENQPIISNPFPAGDPRRGRWDRGWRRGAGNDGMGKP